MDHQVVKLQKILREIEYELDEIEGDIEKLTSQDDAVKEVKVFQDALNRIENSLKDALQRLQSVTRRV